MFHQWLSKVYEMPSFVFFVIMALAVLIWGTLGYTYQGRRGWVIFNRIAVIATVAAIAVITIAVRGAPGLRGVTLRPFAVLEQAKVYPDVYNQMVLNTVLFFPLGAFMPFAIFKQTRYPLIWTVTATVLLSVGIEAWQYAFSCGYTELDDVLLNTAGALMGMTTYWLTRFLQKRLH